MCVIKMQDTSTAELENSSTCIMYRRIYGHMVLWPEILLVKMQDTSTAELE